MTQKNKPDDAVQVVNASPISPHSRALYEAGKVILMDSLETGREFCKSMIGTSTGAIPLYLAILTFILPEDYVLGLAAGGLIALPAIGFLVTAVLFIVGYLPFSGEMSLNDINGIDRERNRIIKHRLLFIWLGLVTFIVSTLGAIWAIIVNIGVR